MTDIDTLITKLEKATGPDWQLADEVLFACGWKTNFDPDEIADVKANGWKCEADNGEEYVDTFEAFMDCACWYPPANKPFVDAWIHGHVRPNPTASIDAAVTLVPEGYHWELKRSPHRLGYFAEIWAPGGKIVAGIGDATTPAIALCIPALRVRSAIAKASGGAG